MQVIALKPQRKQILSLHLGLGFCVLGMLLVPLLCLPFSLLLPLIACPLIGHKTQWVAILAAVAPALISLANGIDTLLSLSLALPCGLSLFATAVLRARKKSVRPLSFACHIAAYAMALLVVSACAMHLFGGNTVSGLANAITEAIRLSPNSGSTLYQLALSGLIGVPAGYQRASVLSFTLDPILIRQLLMSLQLTLNLSLSMLLPRLFIQFSLVGGLFTALRVQRINNSFLLVSEKHSQQPDSERVKLAIPPGFSRLQLPSPLIRSVTLLGLTALVCALSGGTLADEISLLTYTTFTSVFQLVGAAVLICVLRARNQDLSWLYGLLAGVLYIIFPTALFLVGILDPLLHIRAKIKLQHEED